jgi:hypothetical protein
MPSKIFNVNRIVSIQTPAELCIQEVTKVLNPLMDCAATHLKYWMLCVRNVLYIVHQNTIKRFDSKAPLESA